MKCPVCKTNEAKQHPTLGVLPCILCSKRQSVEGLHEPVEFTSEIIKEQRKEFSKEIVQPWRSGEPSKEYIDKYGYKNLGITKEQADKAKPVWGDLTYYEK